MEFGVFDHVDSNGLPLADFYEARLQLVEVYDRGGFYAYHVAEHHATPLGLAASPSVYLAAVVQRTRRLKFGPLVYTLPLYHPLRLIEEICMLDQLSGGRLQVGIGRGISPLETNCFGVDPEQRQRRYEATLRILLQGLTEKAVNFEGEFFRFSNVPMELAPLQTPHPPIWQGIASPDSAARAARDGRNFVSLSSSIETRALTDRYREAWRDPWRGTAAQTRARALHRGGGKRRCGAGIGAARLYQVACEFSPPLAPSRHPADARGAAAGV